MKYLVEVKEIVLKEAEIWVAKNYKKGLLYRVETKEHLGTTTSVFNYVFRGADLSGNDMVWMICGQNMVPNFLLPLGETAISGKKPIPSIKEPNDNEELKKRLEFAREVLNIKV